MENKVVIPDTYWVHNPDTTADIALFDRVRRKYVVGFKIKQTHYNRDIKMLANDVIENYRKLCNQIDS